MGASWGNLCIFEDNVSRAVFEHKRDKKEAAPDGTAP